ncbi:MAG TPA: MBL fold metallo-hydrolase [Longimicrobium sp.]|jgi:glyoxylase-like metal-dependent hydrolase (beta-lactamase superfamily II)
MAPGAAPLQVAPGVHRISVPLPFPPREVAAWLLEGDEGHTLVDTGMDTPPARGALRHGAEHLGVTPRTLRHVVLTHAHIDHYGLAGPVRAWSGARVYMHEREEALIRAFVDGWPAEREGAAAEFATLGVPPEVVPQLIGATDRIHAQYEDFRPDELLAGERGELPGGGGWEWILTSGHSPGHISVYHPERRLLIAGDHVLPRISPNVGADRYVADPLSEYLESLAGVRDLPVDLVLPSHGDPFAELAGRVDGILAHHDERNTQVVALLDRPRSAYDLSLRLFPDLPPDTLLHGLRETLAHLAYLERTARVVREDGVWRPSPPDPLSR